MSSSRAVAVIGKPDPKAKDAKAEKVGKASEKVAPPVEVLRIHSALLLAAESTVGAADPARTWLNGVNLSRREKVGRIGSTDGMRMFMASYALESKIPSWLKDGVTLSSDGLRKRVQILTSIGDMPILKLSHTKGSGFAMLSDERDEGVFRVQVLSCEYPELDRVIGQNSFVSLDEEGQPVGREWEPVGINSRYLKHCGAIAKTLEDGMPKKERPENGMVIRAYNSGATDAPLVFGFQSWPGALLVIAPQKLASKALPQETAAMISGATKLTLAALRAHVTRQLAWAEEASNPLIKAVHEEKAKGFQERIARIIEQTQAQLVIAEEKAAAKAAAEPAPTPAPEPEPTPEPDPEDEAANAEQDAADAVRHSADPEPEPEDSEPARKPEIRRTPIKARRTRNAA